MRFSRFVPFIAVFLCVVCPFALHAETTVKVPVSATIGDLEDFGYVGTFFSTAVGLEAEGKYLFFKSGADYSPNDKNLGKEQNGHSYGVSGSAYGKLPYGFLLGGKADYTKTITSAWEKSVTRYFASGGYGRGDAKIFIHYIVGADEPKDANDLSGASIEAWYEMSPRWRIGGEFGKYTFLQTGKYLDATTMFVTVSYDMKYLLRDLRIVGRGHK